MPRAGVVALGSPLSSRSSQGSRGQSWDTSMCLHKPQVWSRLLACRSLWTATSFHCCAGLSSAQGWRRFCIGSLVSLKSLYPEGAQLEQFCQLACAVHSARQD